MLVDTLEATAPPVAPCGLSGLVVALAITIALPFAQYGTGYALVHTCTAQPGQAITRRERKQTPLAVCNVRADLAGSSRVQRDSTLGT